MAILFRPRLEGLEARETPTALGSVFLGTIPNASTHALARVLETSEAEHNPEPAVDWGAVAQNAEGAQTPGLPNAENIQDQFWNEWGEEAGNGVAENLVADWVFTERAGLG